jgi:uncharacterized protein (DUF433 family)
MIAWPPSAANRVRPQQQRRREIHQEAPHAEQLGRDSQRPRNPRWNTVFVGTRVPFRNLIDYLERNHSLDEFLDAFPTVSKEQVVAALEAAHEAVTARARSAR